MLCETLDMVFTIYRIHMSSKICEKMPYGALEDRVTENKMDGKDIGQGRERKRHRVRMCDRKGAKKRAG